MQKKNIYLLCIITFLQGMVFYAVISTLYRQAAGLSVFQITALEGISAALSLACEIPWGRVADRIGYRRTMIVCNLLFFISKIIFWQAQGFVAFLIERLLLAVVLAGLSGVDASMLYLSAPPQDAQRNHGWYNASGQAGLLLCGALYSAFLSGQYRAAAFWTMVAYGAAALLTFFLDDVKPASEKNVIAKEQASWLQRIRAQFRIPGMLALVIGSTLFGEAIHCLCVYFNQLQYLRAGLNERAIGLAFIGASIMGLMGPLSHRISKKIGSARLCKLLLIAAAISAFVLSLTRSGWISVTLFLLLEADFALFSPMSAAMEDQLITSPDRATAMSINAMLGDSLLLLMDLVLGRMADLSLPAALALCGACCLGASMLMRKVFRKI